jgi:hypothetical protein
LYEALVWSFGRLYHGVWPSTDHLGRPFPAKSKRRAMAGKPLGVRGCIFAFAADMEQMANGWKLRCHASSNSPCAWCDADCFGTPWADMRPTAAWRQTMRRPPATREHPCTNHILMRIPGVVHETFKLDFMHIVDLGMSLYFMASVLWDLLESDMPGSSRATRLAALNTRISALQRELGIRADHRCSPLDLSNFQPAKDDYPLLRRVKAREARYLVPVIVRLCEEHSEGNYASHRLLAAKALQDTCDLVDGPGMFLNDAEHANLSSRIQAFVAHHSWLSKTNLRQGLLRYSITPKFHYVFHLVDQSQWIAPRTVWAYAGESFVGKIATLAHSATPGTTGGKLSMSLMRKYKVALHISIVQGDHAG